MMNEHENEKQTETTTEGPQPINVGAGVEPQAAEPIGTDHISGENPGPVPIDLGEYEEKDAEREAEAQAKADGGHEPPDIGGLLSLVAMLIAQARYKERERQQRFITAWTAEISPMMQLLRVPEALAAIGWTAERGLEALPPWVRLAMAAAWGVYAFKIADQEAQKGVVDGEEIMDVSTGTNDRGGIYSEHEGAAN